MFNPPGPMVITVKHHGKTLTAELPWDSDLSEVMEVIKGLLITDGWSADSVDNHIIEMAEQLKEYNRDDHDENSSLPG